MLSFLVSFSFYDIKQRSLNLREGHKSWEVEDFSDESARNLGQFIFKSVAKDFLTVELFFF